MKAINIKTEYLVNPNGIDLQSPRIFWNAEGGLMQTAYQIKSSNGYDTGKVKSSSMRVEYKNSLSSRERVDYTITLWDENDEKGEPSHSFFEMGLLEKSDWKATWITGNYKPNKKDRYPIDCFKKEFNSKAISKARLYITACGLYEAKLNGKRVGDFVLAPGYTDYNKRIQYQTYDVTDLINDGVNELNVSLADGWYRGSTGAWGIRNQFGIETKFLSQLELTDDKGNITYINSDSSWSWSNDGPILFADNKDGEIVDSNLLPSYKGKAKETFHSITPVASNNVAVKEKENFSVKNIIKTPSGKTVLDFGQNIAGYATFKINAKKGEKITLTFGELIDSEGEFTLKNIQCSSKKKTTPLQRVVYTAKKGVNEYKTTFAVFGFQYILVETDIAWKKEDFTAIAVYSDMERVGYFESSNDLLNKFVENTAWSTKNNHLDIPTDCPTRERHGWTGDAQIFFKSASFLFNNASFYDKYLRDMYDWQKKDGSLPIIVPYGGVDFYMDSMNGSVGWADAGVIIPYGMWKQFNDRSIIEKYYSGMKKYAEFMMKRCGKKTLLSPPLGLKHKDRKFAVNYGQSFGEWAEPADVFPNKWTDMILTHPEVSTAYTAYIMDLMAEIAEELGYEEDKKLYEYYAANVKKSYQALRGTEKYTLDTDRQAMLVRPLALNLLDKAGTHYAKNRLVKAMENYNWRLGTGFLSTPLILNVLADINTEYAYQLLENEEMPGWLFMPRMGATTVWESWEGVEAQGGIASLNHYSKGAVVEWLFETMCGIKVDKENTFEIAPMPGGNFTFAKAEYTSVYGKVVSGWERKDGKTIFTIEIPSNTTAKILLPDGSNRIVESGVHIFSV